VNFDMKLLVILSLMFAACAPDKDVPKPKDVGTLNETMTQQDCFMSGGVEFQTGYTGGSAHRICIYRPMEE